MYLIDTVGVTGYTTGYRVHSGGHGVYYRVQGSQWGSQGILLGTGCTTVDKLKTMTPSGILRTFDRSRTKPYSYATFTGISDPLFVYIWCRGPDRYTEIQIRCFYTYVVVDRWTRQVH